MQRLLSRIMAGRLPAVSVASTCALLSTLLFLFPLSYVGSAVIGLATLRNGPAEGALVLAGTTGLTGAVLWLVVASPLPAVIMAAMMWVPVLLLSAMLRVTAAQGLVLAAAGALVALGAGAFRLAVGDAVQWWKDLWGSMVRAPAGAGPESQSFGSELMQVLEASAPLMTSVAAVLTLLGLFATVLLARWCHAVLDNPGGFAQEFQSLTLPAPLAYVTAGLGLWALVAGGALPGFALDILLILVALHLVCGLAIVHALAARRGASIGWLVLMYALLFLVPFAAFYLVIVLALVGLSDTWLRLRARVGPKGGAKPD